MSVSVQASTVTLLHQRHLQLAVFMGVLGSVALAMLVDLCDYRVDRLVGRVVLCHSKRAFDLKEMANYC